MPNGDVSGGGFPVVDILEGPEVPGTGVPTGPIGTFIESVVSFFGGLFGGGGPQINVQTPAERDARIAEFNRSRDPVLFGPGGRFASTPIGQDVPGPTSVISGRVPIPPPEEGGPQLVTERFRNLPPIPMVPDVVEGPLGFEGIEIMPVDVPLLSSFLPAIRTVAQPTIQGVVGGLAGGFLSEFLRPIQETGLGAVPVRQALPQVTGCPTEKPSTRILRFIKANTGVSINLSRAKSLIRELGLENAARCLGITAAEVCSLLIVASPRRRRGISASDIRIVKRTARRFENLKHDLGHMGGRTGHHHHRRRASRHAHK